MEEEVFSLPFDDNNSERGRQGRLKEDVFVVVFIAANIVAVDDIFYICRPRLFTNFDRALFPLFVKCKYVCGCMFI